MPSPVRVQRSGLLGCMETYESILKSMVGKTFDSVTSYEETMLFSSSAGGVELYHSQDCCESVTIEDICGDLSDLSGSPIIQSEEVSGTAPDGYRDFESSTWTFYKFATIKGSVTVRWLGESNGYYSESVDVRRIAKVEPWWDMSARAGKGEG